MVVPFISREDIRAALDSLIHTSPRTDANGLYRLLLVDLAVNAPEMPDSDAARDYALHGLLVDLITHSLDEQRAAFDLAPVDVKASATIVRREIGEAVRVGARELTLWCALYYRYVRSDLDFSVDGLARLLGVHSRTLPRYLDDGLSLLTISLIKAEQEARRSLLQRRLRAALPYSVPMRLFGRQMLLDHVEAKLAALSPRHLLITGVAGIGKSAFAQELLRRQIAADEFDHLIWIEAPESAAFVRQEIASRLLRENSQLMLGDYLLLYPVALVLDGLDGLVSDLAALDTLLHDLGAAQVFLIHRTPLALESVEGQISITELDRAASLELVTDVLRRNNVEIADDAAGTLYDHLGGNPLMLRLAAGLWEQGHDWTELQIEVQGRLLERLFVAFDDSIRRAWCALALVPNHAKLEEMADVLHISDHALQTLERHHIIVEQPDNSGLQDDGGLWAAAREFVRYNPAARALASAIIDGLEISARTFDLLEYVLITNFPKLADERRAGWMLALWREGLRRGHWAVWHRLLEPAVAANCPAELRMAYGVCLRRLNEWESAEAVFYRATSESGRDGQFDLQALALVEWGILARYRGQYERAQSFFDQARRYGERASADDLLRMLTIQQAQMLVEQGKGAEAQSLLARLPESALVLALGSEAQLTQGNFSDSRLLAERSLRLSGDDLSLQSSLYSLIGRCFQAQGDLQQARAYMLESMSLLERIHDGFALARAQSNLAGILIPLGQLADAGQLLAVAESVQTRLRDRVGLSVTRHNRAVLASYIAR